MEVGKKYSKKVLKKEIYRNFAMNPKKIEDELKIMIDDFEFFEKDGYITRKKVSETPTPQELRDAIIKSGLNQYDSGVQPPNKSPNEQ